MKMTCVPKANLSMPSITDVFYEAQIKCGVRVAPDKCGNCVRFLGTGLAEYSFHAFEFDSPRSSPFTVNVDLMRARERIQIELLFKPFDIDTSD